MFCNHQDFGKLVRRVKPLTPRDLEPGRGVQLDQLPAGAFSTVTAASHSVKAVCDEELSR